MSRAKTLETLVFTGGYRPDRHGHLTAASARHIAPGDDIPPSLLLGLGDAGRAFLTACWLEFESISAAERVLLVVAARLVDEIESHHTDIVTRGRMLKGSRSREYVNPSVKSEANATRQLAALIGQLGMTRARR
jgi:hypothetical protein